MTAYPKLSTNANYLNCMHILLLNFLFLLIIGFICSYPKPTMDKTKIFVCLCFILLLFFRTFVDIQSVPDLEAYSWGYDRIRNISFSKLATASIYDVKISEIGFRYLMKLCGIISPSFTFFLFAFGVLWLIGYIKVINSYSPYIILSLILLVIGSYNQSIFVIRQHLAMVVVFLSYKYIIEKKCAKYLLVIATAFLLHQTAIVILPLYFLYHVRGKKKIILSIIGAAILLYYSFSYMLVSVGNDMLQGYSSYVNSDQKTNMTGAIIVALNLFVYSYTLKKNILSDGINRVLFLSLILGFLISLCGTGFVGTNRLVMYYTSVSFLAIPIMAKYAKNKISRYMIISFFILLNAFAAFTGSGFDSLIDFRLDL